MTIYAELLPKGLYAKGLDEKGAGKSIPEKLAHESMARWALEGQLCINIGDPGIAYKLFS